jgi:hypothetical protein
MMIRKKDKRKPIRYADHSKKKGAKDTTLLLNPTDDSYINASDAAVNYSAQNVLSVTWSETVQNLILIRFDLSGVTGKTLKSATLYLYASTLAVDTTLQLDACDESNIWVEGTVTYSNAPNSYPTIYFDGLINGGVGWKSFDLKTLIQAIADGTFNNNGFCMYVKASNGFATGEFHSKENTNKPYLEIVY